MGVWLMLLLWWCLIQEPQRLVADLTRMMTNSSKGLSLDGAYIDTVAKIFNEEGGHRLIVEEQLYDAPNGKKGLFERHILHVKLIDSIRLQVDPKVSNKEGRNAYLILTYRQSKAGIYNFTDGDDREFGPLLAFRVGVYKQKRAKRIKRDLEHLKTQP